MYHFALNIDWAGGWKYLTPEGLKFECASQNVVLKGLVNQTVNQWNDFFCKSTAQN